MVTAVLQVPFSAVEGAYLLVPNKYPDERGFFCAVSDTMTEPRMPSARSCQARSKLGVIRGLHIRPGGEAKLVRCSAGSIYDVIVDLRPSSPTYLHCVQLQLDGTELISVYVPEGCAHGYQALEDDTDVIYRIDRQYKPDADVVLAYDDPAVGISWPLPPGPMSERDKLGLTLDQVEAIIKQGAL
jgi:dTDP-4-dehydrorhamnose 3,5-epimerase